MITIYTIKSQKESLQEEDLLMKDDSEFDSYVVLQTISILIGQCHHVVNMVESVIVALRLAVVSVDDLPPSLGNSSRHTTR